MRIVVIGQAAFGAKTLEALMDRGENVAAAYVPRGRPDAKPDPLAEAAQKRGVPVHQPKSYRDEQVFIEYLGLKPDLTILAFVTDIIPQRYLTAPAKGAICYHPSLLPRHRGASGINWALIMGDTRTGLTIFWPDKGIDTGPILLQKEIGITSEDTTGSLYFNHLFPMGVEAILESVSLIKEGRAPRIIQDESKATYEPPCDDRVARVDWGKDGKEIYDLVRGCDPQPGAYSFHNSEKVRFYGAGLVAGPSGAGARSGTVAAVDGAGLHVFVPGGTLVINKVRPASAGKMAASEWAARTQVAPGDRFE